MDHLAPAVAQLQTADKGWLLVGEVFTDRVEHALRRLGGYHKAESCRSRLGRTRVQRPESADGSGLACIAAESV